MFLATVTDVVGFFAFLGLMKTCHKLGISCSDYLGCRLGVPGAPNAARLMKTATLPDRLGAWLDRCNARPSVTKAADYCRLSRCPSGVNIGVFIAARREIFSAL